MYIPKQFQIEDQSKLTAFIKTYSFGLLITSEDNIPTATHLPFVLDERENELYLISHMAKANSQWGQLNRNAKVLLIFSGPHAYISPTHYKTNENVPTWNYTAVHIYGTAKLLDDNNKKAQVLESTIEAFEPSYLKQWQQLANINRYQEKMMNGIVAFEIKVDRIEGKFKLSQNRLEEERNTIISRFKQSNHANEKELGDFMENFY